MSCTANSRFRSFYIAAVLILFSSILSGCSQETEAKPSGGPPGGFATNVVGFQSVREDIVDKISIVGSLESNESVDIKSEINGAVNRINFIEGAFVEQGDVLFEIDKEKLEATYAQARANLNLAETTAERYKNLVQTKAVSRQEYDETMASLESNRAAVTLAKEQLSDAIIRAPFDAVVGERLVSLGQFIVQGTQLTSLYSKDPMKVVFNVPERFVGQVSVGQKVRLQLDAFPQEEYEGEVFFIAPKIDNTTRTAMVKAKVPNPEDKLKEGMFANVELVLDVIESAVLIPETALIIKGDTVSVYIVGADDTAQLREIQVGQRFNGMAQVVSGLQGDETVITEGYQKIGPGSKVKVRLEDPTEKKFYEII